jgi:S-adenosylmethionine synthetase
VNRSATSTACYIAKNLVAAGITDRLELPVSYAIGVARPLSLMVETFGTDKIPDGRIIELINTRFDLRPAVIIRDLDPHRPMYKATAAYGHLGPDDIDTP